MSPLVAVLIAGCGGDPVIWSNEVRSLTMSHDPGGPPFPTIPTAECPRELVTYTLSVNPDALEASICEATSVTVAMPIEHKVASIELTSAQLDALVPTLRMLRVVDSGGCGEDKGDVHLTVTTATETTEYADSFYAGCPGNHDDRPIVDTEALDVVEAAFRKLAFPPQP